MITSKVRVTVVILNYEKYLETISCAQNVLAQSDINLTCVIVDNCSMNDSLLQLQQTFWADSRVKVVLAPANHGYASGNNLGAKVAIEKFMPQYLLILNPDIRMPDRHTVASLVSFADNHKDVGCVGPRVVLPNGLVQGPYNRPNLILFCIEHLFPVVWYARKKIHQRKFKNFSASVKCFRTIGACLLLHTESFMSVGMFDEETFLECEEPILAEKLINKKRYFYYYPKTTIYHYHTRQTNSIYTISSLTYYFRKYHQSSKASLAMLKFCAKIYMLVYEPLRQYLHSQ